TDRAIYLEAGGAIVRTTELPWPIDRVLEGQTVVFAVGADGAILFRRDDLAPIGRLSERAAVTFLARPRALDAHQPEVNERVAFRFAPRRSNGWRVLVVHDLEIESWLVELGPDGDATATQEPLLIALERHNRAHSTSFRRSPDPDTLFFSRGWEVASSF